MLWGLACRGYLNSPVLVEDYADRWWAVESQGAYVYLGSSYGNVWWAWSEPVQDPWMYALAGTWDEVDDDGSTTVLEFAVAGRTYRVRIGSEDEGGCRGLTWGVLSEVACPWP